MMFKVGDIVVVRKLLNGYDTTDFRQYLDIPTVIIEEFSSNGIYKLSVDNGKHFWFETELELIELDNLFE